MDIELTPKPTLNTQGHHYTLAKPLTDRGRKLLADRYDVDQEGCALLLQYSVATLRRAAKLMLIEVGP